MGIFAIMSEAECITWLDAYKAEMLETAGGGQVISISGGGESETRADAGVRARRADLMMCRKRLHQINPTNWPAVRTSIRADFSGARNS